MTSIDLDCCTLQPHLTGLQIWSMPNAAEQRKGIDNLAKAIAPTDILQQSGKTVC